LKDYLLVFDNENNNLKDEDAIEILEVLEEMRLDK